MMLCGKNWRLEMIKYDKPTNKLVPVLVVLSICCVVLLVYSQSQNRAISEYKDVNNQLTQTAQRAIASLADSNEHIRAYEIRISQLEEELEAK